MYRILHNFSKPLLLYAFKYEKYSLRMAKFDVDKYGRQENLDAWQKTQIIKEQKNDKPEDQYFGAIESFIKEGKHRHGATEFIYDLLSKMKFYKVHKELRAYKELLKVFPTGIMVPTNAIQVEFYHYPKQQTCAIEVLDNMESNGVAPDEELYDILRKRFGEWTHVLRKFRRSMYWKAKIKNVNPFFVPPLEIEKLTFASLDNEDALAAKQLLNAHIAMYRIFDGVDRDFVLNTFYEQIMPSHSIFDPNAVPRQSSPTTLTPYDQVATGVGPYSPDKWLYSLHGVGETSKGLKEKFDRTFKKSKSLDGTKMSPAMGKTTLRPDEELSPDTRDIRSWAFVTAQSPDQKVLVQGLGDDHKVYVEGPFISWIQDTAISYYQLKAELSEKELEETKGLMDVNEDDYDDVTDWTLYNERENTPMLAYAPDKVHECMPDASKYLGFVIFRQDFHVPNDFLTQNLNELHGPDSKREISRPNKSTLNGMRHSLIYRWLKSLENKLGNPQLSKVPIIIRLNDDPNDIQTYLGDESFVNSRTRDHSRPLNFDEINKPVYKY